MINRKVTIRYVHALLESARQEGCINEVGQALQYIDNIIRQHSDVTLLIYNPSVARERKKRFLTRILPDDSPALVKHFLGHVIEKKREKILESVYREYVIAADTLQGIMRARVVSAAELADGQVDSLKKVLEGVLKMKVALELEIDKNIIGGVKVHMGTNVIDGSVTGRLARFQKYLFEKIGNLKTAA